MIEQGVRLRITVVRPPPGVRFCLQRGKENLESSRVIERFVEDVDIVLDRHELGFTGDPGPSQHRGHKQAQPETG